MNHYKYVSKIEAVKSIISGTLKFATLSSLNDPTELLPKIIDTELKESLNYIRTHGYTEEDLYDLRRQEALFKRLSPETMIIKAPQSVHDANSLIKLSIYENFNYLKTIFNRTIELMGSRCGIFCTSTRSNSLPMWAHYANNAKGFVVEFENLDLEFNGDDTGVLNQINPVVYCLDRTGVTFRKESYKSIFFEKDIDWDYENEWRVITDLNSCKLLKFGDENIFLKKINLNRIKKVIIGWKNSKEEIQEIKSEIIKTNSRIKIVESKIYEGKITTA